jgi:hypothetical protein
LSQTCAIRSFRVQFRFDSLPHAAHNLCARGNVCLSKQLGCIPPMEPTMISLRVLSTVAAIALVLPMAAPTASFAQAPLAKAGAGAGGGGGAPRPYVGGGGGAPHIGGGGAPAMGGGGVRMGGGGGGVPMGGGAPPMGGAPGPRFSGGGGGGGGYGGGYRGGYGGGRHHDHDGRGGFFPGAVAGALVGGAIASQGYYGGPGYYYDDQYYDDGAVAVAPAPGGDDAVAYCMQTYRSYDPQSGTYLGNDGYRHPCP